MIKTISFELSKRLDELWLLRDVETEFIYTKRDIWFWNIDYDIIEWKYFNLDDWDIKTLTTDEALEFLPLFIPTYNCMKCLWRYEDKWIVWYWYQNQIDQFPKWQTPIEAIEKMITYLLDNNLIWPINKN